MTGDKSVSFLCGKVSLLPADEWIIVSGILLPKGEPLSKPSLVLRDTWIWQLSELKWHPGPILPQKVCCGAMVTSSDDQSIFMLGGKHSDLAYESLTYVFKFRCHGHNTENCHWHQMKQHLKYPRHSFLALQVPFEESTCEPTIEEETGCFHAHLFLAGDGYCDDQTNSILCHFDGGDCCTASIVDHFCQECICHKDNTNHEIWTSTTHMPLSKDCPLKLSRVSGIPKKLTQPMFQWQKNFFHHQGDGICDDDANIPLCNYDGNDCCANDGISIAKYCWYCQCHTNPEEEQPVPYFAQCPFDEIKTIGNDVCQLDANNVMCAFDGNDCCKGTYTCSECYCHLGVTEFHASHLSPENCPFYEIVGTKKGACVTNDCINNEFVAQAMVFVMMLQIATNASMMAWIVAMKATKAHPTVIIVDVI